MAPAHFLSLTYFTPTMWYGFSFYGKALVMFHAWEMVATVLPASEAIHIQILFRLGFQICVQEVGSLVG
jgi:hypothetical protein